MFAAIFSLLIKGKGNKSSLTFVGLVEININNAGNFNRYQKEKSGPGGGR